MSTKLIPPGAAPLRLRAGYLPALPRPRFNVDAAAAAGGGGAACCSPRAPCRSGTRMAGGRPAERGADWPPLRKHNVVHKNTAVIQRGRTVHDSMLKHGKRVFLVCLAVTLWRSLQFDIQSAAAPENRSGGDDAEMTDKTMMAAEPQTRRRTMSFRLGFLYIRKNQF